MSLAWQGTYYFWSYWMSVGYPQWAAGYKKLAETWQAQYTAAAKQWQEQLAKMQASLPKAPPFTPFWPFVAPTTDKTATTTTTPTASPSPTVALIEKDAPV